MWGGDMRPGAPRIIAALMGAALLAGCTADQPRATRPTRERQVRDAEAASQPKRLQPERTHVAARARSAGVARGRIHLGSEGVGLTPIDVEFLTRMRDAVLGEDMGRAYTRTFAQPVPNFRLLEASTQPARMRRALLASARVGGYYAQFDHARRGGPIQVSVLSDLFVNPTGASIALRRAHELTGADHADVVRRSLDLGEQATLARLSLSGGETYQVAFRRGRVMGRVLVTYPTTPARPTAPIEVAHELDELLAGLGL
jgi:hypothetical protein